MAYERPAIEWNTNCRIEVLPRFDIEIIALIRGLLTIEKQYEEANIQSHILLEKSGDSNYDINSTIKIDRIDFSKELQGWLRLEKFKITYDHIILGHVKYKKDKIEDKEDVVNPETGTRNNELLGHIYIIGYVGPDYVDDQGKENANELQAHFKIEEYKSGEDKDIEDIINPIDPETGTRMNELLGHIKVELRSIDEYKEDVDPYELKNTQHNEIQCMLTIKKHDISDIEDMGEYDPNFDMSSTIILGHALTKKYSTQDEDIEDEIGNKDRFEIQGSLIYEAGYKIIDLYSHLTLEKTGTVDDHYHTILTPNANEIQGKVTTKRYDLIDIDEDDPNKDFDIKSTIIKGHVDIISFFRALDILCSINIRKREYIYSIFSKIAVPPERRYTIPCRIIVENPNILKEFIISGKVTILPADEYKRDVLKGYVNYLGGFCKDIQSHLFLDYTYTRREIPCILKVVLNTSYYIPCTIEINQKKPPKIKPLPHSYEYPIMPPPKDKWPIVEKDRRIHIKIDDNTVINKNIALALNRLDELYKYRRQDGKGIPNICIAHNTAIEPQHREIIKGKIIIAVSPTWSYNPLVFKSSLITFLDRYNHKADFAIIFGGSPRSDFDIINLSLNYKIRKKNLHQVPIEIDHRNPFIGHQSIQRFINCALEFRKEEYPNILRVFMFVNDPNWYYNDPLAALATFCRTNNISAVCISPGGEYNEICDIERSIDKLQNDLEWERQHRNNRTSYINIGLHDGPDQIVY